MRCAWFDYIVDNAHDMTTAHGFGHAIKIALSIMPGGVVWFGVPCSTFVWMSRSHTKRTRQKPWGDRTRLDVCRANLIVKHVGILLELLVKRSVYFIIEQPAGSLLWWMPVMRRAARLSFRRKRRKVCRWARCFVWLGYYGHEISKPTELQGIFLCLKDILPSRRPMPSENKALFYVVSRHKNKIRVTGRPGLKSTEHYPLQFCKAVALTVAANVERAQSVDKV